MVDEVSSVPVWSTFKYGVIMIGATWLPLCVTASYLATNVKRLSKRSSVIMDGNMKRSRNIFRSQLTQIYTMIFCIIFYPLLPAICSAFVLVCIFASSSFYASMAEPTSLIMFEDPDTHEMEAVWMFNQKTEISICWSWGSQSTDPGSLPDDARPGHSALATVSGSLVSRGQSGSRGVSPISSPGFTHVLQCSNHQSYLRSQYWSNSRGSSTNFLAPVQIQV